MKRILGIDYGDSRIGLALSDGLMITAQPHSVLHVHNGWKNIVPEIHKIIRETDAGKIVIGYPLNLDGTKGSRCEVTDRFITVLSKDIPEIEVVRWDERYTTSQAEGILGKDKKSMGRHDIVSAALILQSYLDFYRK
jgi:putative holliday junction resolvase